MIKLFDMEFSSNCYKIRLLMGFLGVKYELVPVDLSKGEHKSAEFIALNPFGQVPVLVDGDTVIRDSQAILVYLARKYDAEGRWYPVDPAAMAFVQEWLSVASNELSEIAKARATKLLNLHFDLDALHAVADRVFTIMDHRLSSSYFLEGDLPTIADLACFAVPATATEGGIDMSRYPHLVDWIERIKKLNGFVSMPGVWPSPL